MIYVNILCIAIFWVVVIDLSGFIDSLKGFISKIILGHSFYNWDLKPLTCSFCMVWWTAFTYLICVHSVTIWLLTYSILMAFATEIILNILVTIKNLLLKLCSTLLKKNLRD